MSSTDSMSRRNSMHEPSRRLSSTDAGDQSSPESNCGLPHMESNDYSDRPSPSDLFPPHPKERSRRTSSTEVSQHQSDRRRSIEHPHSVSSDEVARKRSRSELAQPRSSGQPNHKVEPVRRLSSRESLHRLPSESEPGKNHFYAG